MVLVVKNPSASAGDMRDLGLVPELGRSPGEGHGDPLQHSRLEKPHEQEEPTGLRSIGLQSRTQLNQLKACMLNIHLSYDPAILLLGIHPREIKACVHAKTCIWIFIATLIVTAQTRHNQMVINKLWLDKQIVVLYIYHRILLSHKKKQWLNLRIIRLSVRNKTESEVKVKVAQLCPTLCDPTDYTVRGILQARILEWVAFPFSRGSSNPGIKPRSPTLQADSLPTELSGPAI